MKKLKFNENVSAVHGAYSAGKVYDLKDADAYDMLNAKFATLVEEPKKPEVKPEVKPEPKKPETKVEVVANAAK